MLRMSVLNSVLLACNCGLSVSRYASVRRLGYDARALSPQLFMQLPVSAVQEESHNVKYFKVQLPSPDHETGLTTSSFVMVKGSEGVARPYTPVSLNSQKGYFELIVKRYPEGRVSSYLHSLRVGDFIEVKGPFPKLEYRPNMKRKIAMVAGGSGITPMLQIIREIVSNKHDKTEVDLLYANRETCDILLQETLESIQSKHPNIRVNYVLSHPPSGWTGYAGHINAGMISEALPPPGDDVLVYVCGPPGMMHAVSGDKQPDKSQGPLSGALKALGYRENMVYKF
mmetsp:Transcript_13476/g.20261  ORF Transcript_13476/g.20261 Transcript_13476/m.20261 type:complete len:284 (+) Transcript_13476:26-877(+)